MFYDYNGDLLDVYPSILFDTYSSVRLPSDLRIKITNTVTIDTSKCFLFDGGGSTILLSGNIVGFEVSGSLVSGMTADPDTLSNDIKNKEAGFIFRNVKIQGEESGTGIVLDSCFKPTINGCYLHHLNTGIELKNICRDVNILGNQIYDMQLYGIHFDKTSNLHQINVDGNIITYCYHCIFIDKSDYIANLQIVGNDIEIHEKPDTSTKELHRCIMIDTGVDSQSVTNNLKEIVIVGNTLQGHSKSEAIIEVIKDVNPTRMLENVTINSNHISNSISELISLTNTQKATINGNTFDVATNYAVLIGSSCHVLSISGNTCVNCGGFIKHTGSTNRLNITNNLSNTTKADPFNVIGSNVTNGMILGNVVSGSNPSVTVNPSSVTRVMVSNNICGTGTYTLHNDVTASNNV